MCLWAQLPDPRKEKGPASPQPSPLNQELSLQATGDIDQGSQQSGHRALSQTTRFLPMGFWPRHLIPLDLGLLLYGTESSSWGLSGVHTRRAGAYQPWSLLTLRHCPFLSTLFRIWSSRLPVPPSLPRLSPSPNTTISMAGKLPSMDAQTGPPGFTQSDLKSRGMCPPLSFWG